ncbi:MAG: carboxypeptidase-like regulatory domain-containing protein [Bacteroidales bacterium]|nr:carboxypeptidase-like regulatory domain-containing protein [Bacteroidales bacterium]
MNRIALLLFLLMPLFAAAQNAKISGVVTDEKGNPLPFVSVAEKGTTNGTISDSEGNFIIKVKTLPATLSFNCIGYSVFEQTFTTGADKLKIKMEEETTELQEVQVTAKHGRSRTDNVIIGVENIQMSEMAKVPALMGERDVIKSIQLLPGIKSEGDGSCGFQVRGGTAAQNLILIDNAVIYNAGHLMGVFSTFNDEALTNASLYKGAIPCQFGDASSSVFDIKTRSGDMQNYGLNMSIGLLSSKFSFDGPIVKDRASFFLAARRSYFEIFLKPTEKYNDKVLNFYDINSKITVKPSKNGVFNVMFFRGRDNMDMGNHIAEIHWGNTAAAVDYKHNFGQTISAKTALIYSNYDFIESMNVLKVKEHFDGYVRHHAVREDITISPTENQKINLGFQFDHINLKSGELESSNGLVEKELRDGDEISFWVGEDLKTNFGLELSFGARGVIFNALGGNPYYNLDSDGIIIDTLFYGKGNVVKRFFAPEPRFSMKYELGEHQSLKAGYCRTSQHLQNIMNNGMSSPIGRSVLSSNIIKPQIADQISVGYMAESKDKTYEFSVEAYYKNIENVYDYKDGKNLVTAIEMESLLLNGKGRAYGAEFYVKKNLGDFTGWFSYTLSWAENKIEGINQGEWYTAPNDRRHDISIVGMYRLNHKWDLSATWVYTSGQALTAPSAKYNIDQWVHYYTAEHSGYRAPAYHRLDVGINNTKERPRYTRIWSFGVYNIYNHYNPYLITFENDDTKATGTKTQQVSLFGLIPSVTYTIKF